MTTFALITFLIFMEGFKPLPYPCNGGQWTIGYGCGFYADGRPVRRGDPRISRHDAYKLLEHHVEAALEVVFTRVTVPLKSYQTLTLGSFVFNRGEAAFKRSTLLRKLNEGDYAGAGAELHRHVYTGKRGAKKKSDGLIKRRGYEYRMWSGAYTDSTKWS